MLLLACEHLGEANAFIEYYKAKKKHDIFIADGIVIYVNYGKGGISLSLNIAKLNEQYKPQLCVLFGTAGNLSNLEIGDIVIVQKVKLIDASLNPILNPVSLNYAREFKSVDCVSVLGNYALNKKLNHFADCIDKESYFFAKATNELDTNGLIIRLISDNNEEFLQKSHIDYSKAVAAVNVFKQIENHQLTEIFLKTHISDLKILFGLKKLFDKKRLTFTMRQNVYKKIIINTSKITKAPFKLNYSFCEQSIKRNCFTKINDYTNYFHNLKDKCAVIFANKKGEFLRKTPDHYTPINTYGYSILQSYNCIYDCSYCFLKGYFKTFNPVIFKNTKDFFNAILQTINKETIRPLYFYLGTFSDPIALSVFDNSYIKFAKLFEHLDAILEIRTKSAMIGGLLKEKPFKNTIIAYSLSPQVAIDKFEHFTPSLKRRLKAITLLDEAGFNIGIRFDPFFINYLDEYKKLLPFLSQIKHLHSIEIGVLRFSKKEYKLFLDKNPAILSGLTLRGIMYAQSSIEDIVQIAETLFYNFKDKIYYNMLI